MTISCELWTINKWLRYTGWRLCVSYNLDPSSSEPTRIGFKFYGWRK